MFLFDPHYGAGVSMSKEKSGEPTIRMLKGLRKDVRDALEAIGIYYIKDLLLYSPNRLSELTGISKERCEKILDMAIAYLDEQRKKIMTLEEFQKVRGERIFISTGSHSLNRILHGGWSVGEVTELAGPYATGKSQAVYTALATVFLPPISKNEINEVLYGGEEEKEEGEAEKSTRRTRKKKVKEIHWGLNSGDNISAVIVDAERTFDINRFKKILKRFELEEREILKRIFITRPESAWDQRKVIEGLVKVVRENNVKLVVVDSLTKLPRADFSGQGELYARQRLIFDMVEKLRRIAVNYRIVVLITNQVVATPSVLYGRGYKPIGGHVLAHTVDTRLLMVRLNDPYRKVMILDSSWLPPAECKIRISEEGIMDA